MVIKESSLDDLLLNLYKRMLSKSNRGLNLVDSTKGSNKEVLGAILTLTNPRERLSRSVERGRIFSALGEFLWYMSGSNKLDQIEYYVTGYSEFSDDNKTVHGAYGPRLMGQGKYAQLPQILRILDRKSDTRQAVIQLFDAEDLKAPHKDIPCTCTLQFVVRKNRLTLITHMRSNDIYLGLPHDFFSFTMLQELVARILGFELGHYIHMVNSLHFYEKDQLSLRAYISEDFQSSKPMPPMPTRAPLEELNNLVRAEELIRARRYSESDKIPLSNYWKDLATLLKLFNFSKPQLGFCDIEEYRAIEKGLLNKDYHIYSSNRRIRLEQQQLNLGK